MNPVAAHHRQHPSRHAPPLSSFPAGNRSKPVRRSTGGPLLSAGGEVIGINIAMRAAAQNIGFATPINTLKRILSEAAVMPDQ